jgi:hypothetical protein
MNLAPYRISQTLAPLHELPTSPLQLQLSLFASKLWLELELLVGVRPAVLAQKAPFELP